VSSHKDDDKQSGYRLTGVAWSILVMGVSLAAIVIIYISFGHIGSSFSTVVMKQQQEELRERYGLPPLPPVSPEEAEIPPSLRGTTTTAAANDTESGNATAAAATTTSTNATAPNNQTEAATAATAGNATNTTTTASSNATGAGNN
jgi:hypothetical protein